MPKVMYSGVEYVSSVDSVSVSQAEYDALVAAGTVNPAVAYYITDAKDVTCNLGDLTDVNVVGASTGDLLVKTANGWEKHTPSYNDLTDKPTIDSTLSTSSTNAVQNKVITSGLFFGGKSKHYVMSQTTIDNCIAQVNANGFFTIDNSGMIGSANRQFLYGWVNDTKQYGWVVMCSFDKLIFGKRFGASTFTLTTLAQ